MPEQYVATDKRTGLEVAVTGEFPPHPDDRMRIARTTTLFTRLMSTILANTSESVRRDQFVAIETQLEIAEALIRGDFPEVQRLLRSTMERMGITQEQLDELARRIVEEFGGPENIPPDLQGLFDVTGRAGEMPPAPETPLDDTVDESSDPIPGDDRPEAVSEEAAAEAETPEPESPPAPDTGPASADNEDEDDDGPIELGPAGPA